MESDEEYGGGHFQGDCGRERDGKRERGEEDGNIREKREKEKEKKKKKEKDRKRM